MKDDVKLSRDSVEEKLDCSNEELSLRSSDGKKVQQLGSMEERKHQEGNLL